jgi:putative transposase
MRFNEPGRAHELTFSCYRRLPILSDSCHREFFLETLASARIAHRFDLWAYVIMPEHVHLLIWPRESEYDIAVILRYVRQTSSRKMLAHLRATHSPLLASLQVRDEHRVWQLGSGYDRNLFTPRAIHASINYIHENPVRRGLVASSLDWPWSSARWYHGMSDSLLRVDTCPVYKTR